MDFTNIKLSRIAGYLVCCLAGFLMVSCEDEICNKPELVMCFGDGDNGDGDLYREIPAEGGSITLLSADESTEIWDLQSCYLINRPLEWFVTNRVEKPSIEFNLFFRTNLHEDIKKEAFDGVEFYVFTDGYKNPDKCLIQKTWTIPLLHNVGGYHYGDADWLQIRIFKDNKIEVEAAANNMGKDRYISFIYDINNYPFFYYGSIEVKQPALK